MEQTGSRQPGAHKNLLEKWRGYAGVGKTAERERKEEREEDKKYFSASEILSWEKKHSKTNGKYIEALQASISKQISGRILFNKAIASVC